MTPAEIYLLIEANNNKLELQRRDMFVLAGLISYAFSDPKKMPKYEQVYQNSIQVNENPTPEELKEIHKRLKQDWQVSKSNMDFYVEHKKSLKKGGTANDSR